MRGRRRSVPARPWPAPSQKLVQLIRQLLRTRLVAEDLHEAAIGPDQVTEGRVIDEVVAVVSLRRLHVEHPIFSGDLRYLLRRAGQSHHTRVKGMDVVLQLWRRVALRIHGDQHRYDPFAFIAQEIDSPTIAGERGRADVRAVGIAEVDEQPLAAEILIGNRLAVLVDEREGPADRAPGIAAAGGLRLPACARGGLGTDSLRNVPAVAAEVLPGGEQP